METSAMRERERRTAHGDVPGGVAGTFGGGVEDALESYLVSPEAVHALPEQGCVRGRVARDVEPFKLDRDIRMLS